VSLDPQMFLIVTMWSGHIGTKQKQKSGPKQNAIGRVCFLIRSGHNPMEDKETRYMADYLQWRKDRCKHCAAGRN
jgi:hypothetical protein